MRNGFSFELAMVTLNPFRVGFDMIASGGLRIHRRFAAMKSPTDRLPSADPYGVSLWKVPLKGLGPPAPKTKRTGAPKGLPGPENQAE